MKEKESTIPHHVYPANKACAEYKAVGCDVWMTPTDGNASIIRSYKHTHTALKAAARWQKKENRAVLKSQNYI